MENEDKRHKNLKPFKKGDPKERWDNRNNAGRPKGRSIKGIFREILLGKCQIEDPEGAGYLKVEKKTAIAIRLIYDAYSDKDPVIRQKAAKLVLDYTDPIKQKIKHDGKIETTGFLDLPIEKRLAILEIINKPE